MEKFKDYSFIESNVKALMLDEGNQSSIMKAILNDAISGKIQNLNIDIAGNGIPTITFRYKNTTVSTEIKPGQYLIILDSGDKFSMDADKFVEQYETSTGMITGAYADLTILDE